MKKKLLLLGGSRYLIPVIKAARELGCYVITCDYLPDNYAHKFSDEYCNISIIDKDAVLAKAQELKIDGIMSFACDPGVVTAAYVAEKMGLPFQGSYESTCILQDKGLFRQFLSDNHFNTPHAKRYEKIANIPKKDYDFFQWPVIVKPVDSAGSKGVTKVDSPDDLPKAIQIALSGSHNGAFIIEDFLIFDGYHSSADPFTVDGELKFVTYSDHLFDNRSPNPYTPVVTIWPTTMKQKHQDFLSQETQRLMNLLNMRTGIYNIETCVANGGKPYIMEVSPRGGGCGLAKVQQFAYQVNLIENEVRKAIGLPLKIIYQTECHGHWCEMVIHTSIEYEGVLKAITISPEIQERYVKVVDLAVKPGDVIKPFTGANMSLGDIILHFDSRSELNDVVLHSDEWLKIETI